MSHFTKVTAEIRDLTALEQALSNMNLRLESNTACRYYYGTQRREHVIKLPGPYDVALEAQNDGSYDLDADFYDGHVAKIIGPQGAELLRQYSIEKLKNEAKGKGYKVFPGKDGGLKIIDSKTSGKVDVQFLPNGQIEIKTSGFKGKSCMKFEAIEKALGCVKSVKKTPEYYQEDSATVRLKEWS